MNAVETFTPSLLRNSEEQLQALEQVPSDGAQPVNISTGQALWPAKGLPEQFDQVPAGQVTTSNTAASAAPQNLAKVLLAGFRAKDLSVGTATSALTGSGGTTLPNVDNMPYYIQQGNSCGTTTLAEIMSYLGVPMTQADVDNVIRKLNTFTAPEDMINFAHQNGLSAEGYNNGSWDQVKSMIDSGYPVQALVEGDDSVPVSNGGSQGNFSVSGLHYIAITGYGTDPATGEQYVTYHDPNRDTEQRMSVSDFEKMWSNVPGGFNNYFMAYGPAGANLPPGNDNGVQGTLGVLSGVTNITNGLGRIYPPTGFGSEVHGIADVLGGIPQTIGCGIGAGLQLGASWLNNEVNGIPVLQNIVQPFGDILNGAGAVCGDVCNGIGEAWDAAGGAFEDLCNGNVGGFVCGVGDAVGDVASGAASAVSDAASAVGDAISDVFSGW
ncbi:MAG: C39 family peptidase [Acidobacteriia bacterium]|nr:C39 family peptidase [Terriglobia bacterium]